MSSDKPLGRKVYGHIPHLPGSRLGPGDHKVTEGQARISLQKTRDRHDRITVTEKLDGSNVAVCKLAGVVIPLVRAGYRAESSRCEQHHLFAHWVYANYARFDALLAEGERLVGEWLAQAYGTIYALQHEPFVAFDLMRGHERGSVCRVHPAGPGKLRGTAPSVRRWVLSHLAGPGSTGWRGRPWLP